MKKNLLLMLLAIACITWSCSDTKDKTKDGEETEETEKKKKSTDEEEVAEEDTGSGQSSPEGVMKMIFSAAKSGNYSSLSGLCSGDAGDSDVKMICGLESETTEKQESFKEYFSTGEIVGEPDIDGTNASVNFTFGPDGDKKETMKMVKKGKKWYLSQF